MACQCVPRPTEGAEKTFKCPARRLAHDCPQAGDVKKQSRSGIVRSSRHSSAPVTFAVASDSILPSGCCEPVKITGLPKSSQHAHSAALRIAHRIGAMQHHERVGIIAIAHANRRPSSCQCQSRIRRVDRGSSSVNVNRLASMCASSSRRNSHPRCRRPESGRSASQSCR